MFRILYRFLASLAQLAVRSGRSKDLEIIVPGPNHPNLIGAADHQQVQGCGN